MVIAINTVSDIKDTPGGPLACMRQLVSLWAASHPEHRFILLVAHQPSPSINAGEAVETLAVGDLPSGPARRYLWYQIKLPGILKKIGADFYLGLEIPALNSRVPQIVFLGDLRGFHHPESFSRASLLFYKSSLKRGLPRAGGVLTLSPSLQREIVTRFTLDPARVHYIPGIIGPEFRPLEHGEREEAKAQYGEGHEYFVYTGPLGMDQNLIGLLKAFSIFKKRQKSGMKLVLAGPPGYRHPAFLKELSLYKYRGEVRVEPDLPLGELARVTAGAYAMVYPAREEGFPFWALSAMRSGVPVVVAAGQGTQEQLGDAALYFDPTSVTQMAEGMMQLYRDEGFRTALIDKGRQRGQSYHPKEAADQGWKVVEGAFAPGNYIAATP
ncbi:MAG: glycosyltransferase family 4 protein [Bacteroidota bacterium]|nr:glycosyltransferase family 4 protein [Bacteroidota bacterium]